MNGKLYIKSANKAYLHLSTKRRLADHAEGLHREHVVIRIVESLPFAFFALGRDLLIQTRRSSFFLQVVCLEVYCAQLPDFHNLL